MMESKLNKEAVVAYAEEFCSKILGRFFSNREKITGSQILELTPVKQINLFIIKDLFTNWEKQLHSLRSPYFNYESENVKKALSEYMNVLSRNISINKQNFEQLLKKAVIDTLELIFSPQNYFSSKVKIEDREFLSGLRGNKKYYQINRIVYEALDNKLVSAGVANLSEDKLDGIINSIFNDLEDQLEDPHNYVTVLSEVVPLNPSEFFSSEIPSASSLPVESENKHIKTLNEAHAEKSPTIAETMQRGKIENIENILTVNQRFMFVKELFEGNVEEFKKVISYLDNCTARHEALKYLEDNYGKMKNWDIEKEVVIEFYDLVSRKFITESTQ